MENILIKCIISLQFVLNLLQPLSVSGRTTYTQLFYDFDKHAVHVFEQHISELSSYDLPVIVMMDAQERLNKGQLNRLKQLQDTYEFPIILRSSNNLEQTIFVTQGYDDLLSLAGTYDTYADELFYEGKKTISFEKMRLSTDPQKALETSSIDSSINYALIIDADHFNLSTILLFEDKLKNRSVDLKDYSMHIGPPDTMYLVFDMIGRISRFIFIIAIIVLSMALVLFRKWSMDGFLE